MDGLALLLRSRHIILTIYDDDVIGGNDHMGECRVDITELTPGSAFTKGYDVVPPQPAPSADLMTKYNLLPNKLGKLEVCKLGGCQPLTREHCLRCNSQSNQLRATANRLLSYATEYIGRTVCLRRMQQRRDVCNALRNCKHLLQTDLSQQQGTDLQRVCLRRTPRRLRVPIMGRGTGHTWHGVSCCASCWGLRCWLRLSRFLSPSLGHQRF
jgi:hypothetical protein